MPFDEVTLNEQADPAVAACQAWCQAWFVDYEAALALFDEAGEPKDGPIYEAKEALGDLVNGVAFDRVVETPAASLGGVIAKLLTYRRMFDAFDDEDLDLVLDSAVTDLRRMGGVVPVLPS